MISMQFLVFVVLSFLAGSIPTAYLFVKRLKGVDIRTIGSRNAGATNAARAVGKPIGFGIFLIDLLKGALPVLAGMRIVNGSFLLESPEHQLVAMLLGIAAFLGHCYSPFIGFRGGKGVATGLGVYLVVAPLPALLTFAVAAAIIATIRLVSVASITGAVMLPVCIFLFSWREFLRWQNPPWVVLLVTIVLCAMVIFRHRTNIRRLRKGEEERF